MNPNRRDVALIMTSRAVRAFAFSYLTVIFAIYLDSLGHQPVAIGLIHSLAFISSALLTAVWGFLSDRYGRKIILVVLASLAVLANAILLLFSHLFFIVLAVAIANVGAGGGGGGGQGGGPFNPVEQALLAEKCSPDTRNRIFSANAFAGSVLGAIGALVSGLPQYIQEAWGWEASSSYKPLFGLTMVLSLALVFVYRAIREEHRPLQAARLPSKQSTTFVTKLSLLGMIDSLGSGLIGPLISYWFFLRFGVELKSLGILFFLSYLFAALSFLAAPAIARRLGVVRAMAGSHAIASVLYLIIPFAPTFAAAGVLLVIRSFLAYIDIPLRASYIMAMVQSGERGSAAGVTDLARVIPYGVSPTIAAYLMQSVSLTVPLFMGGSLQLIHDFSFYYLFRKLKPPEEELEPAPH
jgi:MFS family permease